MFALCISLLCIFAEVPLALGLTAAIPSTLSEYTLQAEAATFDGVVVDIQGNPVPQVTVEVLQDGVTLAQAVTDARGKYHLSVKSQKPVSLRYSTVGRISGTLENLACIGKQVINKAFP
jgi:hypothetical protein